MNCNGISPKLKNYNGVDPNNPFNKGIFFSFLNVNRQGLVFILINKVGYLYLIIKVGCL